jgi:hypothetical protein
MAPQEKLLLLPLALGLLSDFANLIYVKQNWDPNAKRWISHILYVPQLLLYLPPLVILWSAQGIVFYSTLFLVGIHLALAHYVMSNREYRERRLELRERSRQEVD